MTDWNQISITNLTGGFRIDPEYYQSGYLDLDSQLLTAAPLKIERFAYVTDGIHASPEWVEENGVTYLSAKSVKNNEIILDNAGQISKEQNAANPRTQAQIDDVLLTTVGTIGNAAVVTEDVLPANMDRHLGIIRIRNKELVDPYYLATFLNCKFGQYQSIRESTGNVQLNLFIDKINKMLVPVGPQFNEVGNLTRQTYALRKKSLQLYQEAKQIFLEGIGIKDLDLSTELYDIGSLMKALAGNRLDTEYFQAKYIRSMNAVEETNPRKILPFGELLSTLTNGHTPRHHDLKIGDVPFLTAEHIYDFQINFDSNKRILREHHELLLRRTRLKSKDILITIKGRVGNAAVVEAAPDAANINQDVALLRVKDSYHPYFVVGFVNSIIGKSFVEQISTGQINPFLSLGKLQQIPIPIYEIDKMNEIGQLIEQKINHAYQTDVETRASLKEAKNLVETLIQGNFLNGLANNPRSR